MRFLADLNIESQVIRRLRKDDHDVRFPAHHLVPFVEDEKLVFLKTIIPSRKATKQYLGREPEVHEA